MLALTNFTANLCPWQTGIVVRFYRNISDGNQVSVIL
jgi:hypothetical protein